MERLPAPVAAAARVTDSAPRRGGIEAMVIVHPHDPVGEPRRHPVRPRDVAGPDRRAEPIVRIVRLAKRVLLVVDGDHDRDRTEDLLASAAALVREAGDHGGFDEEAVLEAGDGGDTASGRDRAPFFRPELDVAEDA